MRYYANPNTDTVRQAMSDGWLSCILTPRQGLSVPEDATWCADNGCYGNGYPGDHAWWAWLESRPHRERCAFAVAPDVVGNANATLVRCQAWLPKIRSLGIPAAFVAQDGIDTMPVPVPWSEFDVLFIGGSTSFKLGRVARQLTAQARAKGMPVHMGRVNSYKRLRYAAHIGCTSVDGTLLVFGPDTNLPRIRWWLSSLDQQRDLFGEHV